MVKVRYREAVQVRVAAEWAVLKQAPAANVFVRVAAIRQLIRGVSRAIR